MPCSTNKSIQGYNKNYFTICNSLLLLLLLNCFPQLLKGGTKTGNETEKDICRYLSNRSDKNFLGTGNVAIVVQSSATYPNIFDINHDGLYETYPWSSSAGQKWTSRFLYFNPIDELFRNERGRIYAPDGKHAAEDMELVKKIRNTVVADPELHWPAQ